MKKLVLKIVFIILLLLSPLFFATSSYAKKSCGLKGELQCEDWQICKKLPKPQPDGLQYACFDKSDIKIGEDYTITNVIPAFSNIADIINKLIPYLYTFAGIALFVLIIVSGFEFLTSAGDEKKVNQAKGRITAALAGFIIMVAAYWLAQIAEYIFHITIF